MRRGTYVQSIAALIVIGAWVLDFRVVDFMLRNGLPTGADSVLLGTILTAWNGAATGVIVSFFFGRSSDSDRKTEILANATPAAAAPTAAATPPTSQTQTP
ncbi:hypothetical protein SAMN02800692_1530 [Luteibacter sp. UNC138MFCol5.1]|uniref:hypothetical protein n=1 Tax=Luteibacter sp. UNC138MFCol5.1 TaxID=1502774 RepID=UPI0008C278ED|nr:hypothetical protein [Luteibacter sp. UNC138MFCol5.1]SEO63678.1 hypothetical protein SAMN02800692_1530 [Luteibacter sp. UNC138MFCol5.1]